jgi:hypothetical protein
MIPQTAIKSVDYWTIISNWLLAKPSGVTTWKVRSPASFVNAMPAGSSKSVT